MLHLRHGDFALGHQERNLGFPTFFHASFMAGESTDSLVAPEKIEVDSENTSKSAAGSSDSLSNGHQTRPNHRRASIGSSYHAGDSSARNSTEKSDSANSSQNVVPHYLRASTGSCHDFCKYGKKHSSEEKPWKPLRRRIKKPLLNEHPVLIMVSGDRKKDKVVNPKDSKNHSPELKLSPDTKSDSPKPKTSSDKKKVIKNNKPSTDTKNLSLDLPSPDKKTYLRKPKTSSDAKTYSPKQNASSGNKAVLPKSKKPSSSKKFPLPDPPEIVKSVIFPI
ncbi:hypothetical protein DH2020_009287 [Rehmannia glutinosa]|uniref:Uncharacterized protein n=1 Tax=Rehmannia glutinosa TaxID=99300 RepID=A0ABR0X8X0_REHGL